MRPMSKKRAESTDRMHEVRPRLDKRCGGFCECCCAGLSVADNGTFLYEAHHRKQRSLGGEDDLTNLMAVCAPCHRRIHDEIGPSTTVGWLVPRRLDPAKVPLWYQCDRPALLVADDAAVQFLFYAEGIPSRFTSLAELFPDHPEVGA